MPPKVSYSANKNHIHRHISLGELESSSRIKIPGGGSASEAESDLAKLWQQLVLQGAVVEPAKAGLTPPPLYIADLFCGCGGFTQGVSDAAKALGFAPHVIFSADIDKEALSVYRRNFQPDEWHEGSVSDLIDFQWTIGPDGARFKYQPVPLVPEIKELAGNLDVLVAGPPCQGHSNLNNHTRRDDPRNMLYLTVPAIAVATQAKCVIIENVPEVVKDSRSVVTLALDLFHNHGYHVASKTISAYDFGAAQTRRRHIVVAVHRDAGPKPLFQILDQFKTPGLTLADVIGDLEHPIATSAFDSVATLSDENQMRINYLFDHDLYELPDAVRPDCHKNGHTYRSVYGRLHWEEPSPTITTGFLTPGRGRYIHPHQRRTLTPHEAARIQAFPDSFKFAHDSGSDLTKKTLTKIIGQAVPPPLGYAAALVALGSSLGKVISSAEPPIANDQQKTFCLDD